MMRKPGDGGASMDGWLRLQTIVRQPKPASGSAADRAVAVPGRDIRGADGRVVAKVVEVELQDDGSSIVTYLLDTRIIFGSAADPPD